jgi:hypothetical protein
MSKKLPEMLVRWNVAEPILRDILKSYGNGTTTADDTIVAIDSLLASATGRGGEAFGMFCESLPESKLPICIATEERYSAALQKEYTK